MDEKTIRDTMQAGRDFIHMPIEDDSYESDQELKKPQPPLFKEPISDQKIALPVDFSDLTIDNDFLHIINSRASHRVFTQKKMSLLELSYLLWCSQGVKTIRGQKYATIRTVPCGGARHEFECYMAVQNIDGLNSGLYHYLPQYHALELIDELKDIPSFISDSLAGQSWASKANAVFYYSYVCYRSEWRYGIYSHRVVLIDSGHITENVYLSATSIRLGACAIGYIDEAVLNKAFALDGKEEFMFYACPVGTIDPEDAQKEDDFYSFVKEQGL